MLILFLKFINIMILCNIFSYYLTFLSAICSPSLFNSFFKKFYLFIYFFISWRLITLQYYSGFCHTLTWISHVYTCIPHPDPPSHLPLHPIPLGLSSAFERRWFIKSIIFHTWNLHRNLSYHSTFIFNCIS